MENSQNTKEPKPKEQTDRNSDQQTGPKEIKQEQAPKNAIRSHQAGNKLSATLQKMFHAEGQSDKSKKGSETESEKSEISNLSTQSGGPKVRFQKTDNGSHVHNLIPNKRGHRVQNFLKELGIHGHNSIVEPQNHELAVIADKLHIKHSETSLSGKYGKPQEVIGKGAFGIVRIAHKTEPKVPGEKLFAVKEFKKRSNEPAKKYIKRLTSEFCISSSLHHINVISTLDLLQDAQGNYCEVMEYCPGGDLYSLIVGSGGLEQDEANCFFGQLINGVKYLHDNGVAHRDLKPENLLFTSTGCLKITDFGTAECFRMAWESQPHSSHGICGSGPYIAPEEFKEDSFDPRLVDIWACGIIYMAMITCKIPWRIAREEDYNFKAYKDAKTKGSILTPLQNLNKGPHEIMSRIIEPNPKYRITTEQIIEDAWFSHICICHRPTLSTNEYQRPLPNTSCAINAADQQAMTTNEILATNVI